MTAAILARDLFPPARRVAPPLFRIGLASGFLFFLDGGKLGGKTGFIVFVAHGVTFYLVLAWFGMLSPARKRRWLAGRRKQLKLAAFVDFQGTTRALFLTRYKHPIAWISAGQAFFVCSLSFFCLPANPFRCCNKNARLEASRRVMLVRLVFGGYLRAVEAFCSLARNVAPCPCKCRNANR